MTYQLRAYQTEAVQATISHFQKETSPAVIVLPTGAGKSLVIAELARKAHGRVLVLAHVRELVEQNYEKYLSFNLEAGIYSAGLSRKDHHEKTIFGSIQSIARAPEDFFKNFSLLVIDECHRVSTETETQYSQVIELLKKENPTLCILGLTATPYRLGFGWIYELNSLQKIRVTKQNRFFKKCIFELSIRYMIKNKYLTQPIKIDSPVACYDFSSLKLQGSHFLISHIEAVLKDQKRITPTIIKNIVDMSADRNGVMIFTSSVHHAKEIMQNLPPFISALVVGETPGPERDETLQAFKNRELKFLVNVSVLTTGFDAPHVDVIAILRPTESVSLYQQIVGRGLRLSPDKKNCLILDYTGQNHDIYSPEIEDKKINSESVSVEVTCPNCGLANQFWGLVDADGIVIEHYGRQCKGVFENPINHEITDCGFRFRFKFCDQCNSENDIAAKTCEVCQHILIDTDQKLKEAMTLKDAHVLRVDSVHYEKTKDKKGQERLEIKYYDADANVLKEFFYLNNSELILAFQFNFVRRHNRRPEQKIQIHSVDDVIKNKKLFRDPVFVIARKQNFFWTLREKVFNTD